MEHLKKLAWLLLGLFAAAFVLGILWRPLMGVFDWARGLG